MDIWNTKKRSEVMRKIKGANTIPERTLRSALHKNGFRFRKNVKTLPGKPDIVLPKYKIAIFVHGCFWHHHEKCSNGKFPKTNQEFWLPKINATINRDKMKIEELNDLGWEIMIFWECEIEQQLEEILIKVKESTSEIIINPQKKGASAPSVRII